MPPSPVQLLVVTHTHWDREWYHTAERFRQRLVALVDELLDDPPPPGASFLLDGQAVLLDDYLAVRPERAAELSALLRDGRLEAGPWYVLADEQIPSGEALVRNLALGRETVRRLRGEPPPVLYCPDSFGHPAILPELARGFGCTLAIAWRGYGGARWPAGDTVRWRGPSGARVLLHHLPPDGYEFGSALPHEASGAARRWAGIAETLLPRARTGVALLLNGADHHARQAHLVPAVKALRAVAAPATVRLSSLRDAAAAIVNGATHAELPEVTGELRDSYGYTWTLGGTLATRAAQKRRNAVAERTLVRDVEPWIALGDARALAPLLRAAWRDLLLAHPHDTLCGTSVDAVADAMDHRLATVRAQAEGLRADALARVLGHDADEARRDASRWRACLVLRNPAARARAGVADVTIARTVADVAVGPGSATRQGVPTEPRDDLAAAGLQVLGRSRRVALTEAPRSYPDADLVEEVRALAWVGDIPGYAIETRLLDGLAFGAPPQAVQVEGQAIDNGLLRASVDGDGQLRLEHHATGRRVEHVVRLELARDAGDLYTPAIRDAIAAPRFQECRVAHAGPLRGELVLCYRDVDDLGELRIHVGLDAGLDAVRIAVHGDNRRSDARLRLILATDAGSSAATVADAAFHPVARGPLAIPAADAAMEQVVPTAPLHRFVSRYGAVGATVVSDGLAEYESLGDGGVAITLWRAVGTLSRHDLPERPGHAGWPAPTPGAQAQGPYDASFALALHGEDTPVGRDAVERLAEDVLLPLAGETLRSNFVGPQLAGGLALHGDGLAFSAAIPARQAGWIVLRCVNRRAEPVQGRWLVGRPVLEAWTARLDETPEVRLNTTGGAIAFVADPMAIVTIVARLADDAAARSA